MCRRRRPRRSSTKVCVSGACTLRNTIVAVRVPLGKISGDREVLRHAQGLAIHCETGHRGGDAGEFVQGKSSAPTQALRVEIDCRATQYSARLTTMAAAALGLVTLHFQQRARAAENRIARILRHHDEVPNAGERREGNGDWWPSACPPLDVNCADPNGTPGGRTETHRSGGHGIRQPRRLRWR